MVHALELVHSLLSPDGVLIDIHPSGEPYIVEIEIDGRIHQLGELQESDNYEEYFQADEALQKGIQVGLYALTRQEKFTYLDHAGNLEELRSYLLESWSDLIWPEDISARAIALCPPGKAAVVPARLREDVVIRSLLRLRRANSLHQPPPVSIVS